MDAEHFLLMAFDEFNQHVETRADLLTPVDMQATADQMLMEVEDASFVMVWTIDGDAFIERNAEPAYQARLPWV